MTRKGRSRPSFGRVHAALARHVTDADVPGLVALVSHRGETWIDVQGKKARGPGDPVSRNTLFRISSMSKPITGAATMALVDDGKLRLDEPVDRLLPELSDRRVLRRVDGPLEDTVPAKRPITVRDLLTFTMGFGMMFADPNAVPILKAASDFQIGMGPPSPSAMPPSDEWARRLGTLPLMYQPGERWMYNTGADVLSVLIARASGRPLETYLRERLFDPLGMTDTSFSVPPAQIDRLTPCYWTNFMTGKEEVYDEARGGQWSRPPAFPSGAGGLVSTADDYLAFARMLLNRGTHEARRLLSAGSVEAMTKDQLTPAQKKEPLVEGFFDTHGWGFCLSVVTAPDQYSKKPGRYGWDGGMGTAWFNDPNEDLAAILMTNRMWTSADPPPVCRDFWAAVYESLRA